MHERKIILTHGVDSPQYTRTSRQWFMLISRAYAFFVLCGSLGMSNTVLSFLMELFMVRYHTFYLSHTASLSVS